MTLEKVLLELDFIIHIKKAINKKFKKDKNIIKKIATIAYSSNDFDFPLCKQTPFMRLVVVTYLLTIKYNEYKELGVSEDIIWDTFRDVSLRANFNFQKSGNIGFTKDDVIWFRHIMNVNIFKIGSLQFQNFEMLYLDKETIGEEYMTFTEEQKKKLPNGSPVINCHIQRNANISNGSVEESFKQAKLFFEKYFPSIRHKAFLCYSWLLYPPMLRLLNQKSNIKQFAEYFSIISFCKDSEQAMEHLFADTNPKNVPSYTSLTSLQRLAIEQTDKFGFGCGIITI